MKLFLYVFSIVVALSGCATVDPYTGEQKTSNAVKGSAIGALSGAAIGAIAGKGKGALIGAAAGAAAGGGIGYYMDRQETALRQRLEGTGVQIQRNGDNLKLIMPGNITFASNSPDIHAGFYETLNSVTLVLKEFDSSSLDVIGYTDSTGSFEHNQTLSERRAASVANYLTSQGISRSRIADRGMGERYPVASNDSPQGRAANRRVELDIRPNS